MTPSVAERSLEASEAGPRVVARGRLPAWLLAALPLVLLAALMSLIVWWGPADAIRGDGYPPVERLTFQRVQLTPEGIVATVMNDGPDLLTIAQVQIDEAYWAFRSNTDPVLKHLGRATLTMPYPWVQGEAHVVKIVTSTGTTFEHEIAVAVPTPQPDARHFWVFTLIGVYVGVIPVAIGLIWFPLVKRLGKTGLDFLLALTVGLLLFLLVDASGDGLESAAALPESFQGVALFAFVAFGAYLALEALGAWLRRRRREAREERAAGSSGWILALLVAIGIGLHNFGEGLAIGAAFALGEAALGSLLIVGFTLHNTTEGLAIVAPLARDGAVDQSSPRVADLIVLGLIGGAPTIAGAWLGGFVYSQAWSVVFLGIGVGAIAQVVVQIVRQMAADRPLAHYLATPPIVSGLLAGFIVMYATGMLVG